jgi:dUTP pyrophosphatase
MIDFKVLDVKAVVPKAASDFGAGLDLTVIESVTIPPGKMVKCRTGLAVALPSGTFGLVQPRSSAYVAGLAITGCVDSEFRGEIFVMIRNTNDTPFYISEGNRYAQMLVLNYCQDQINVVQSLGKTQRGEGGFGSTGK